MPRGNGRAALAESQNRKEDRTVDRHSLLTLARGFMESGPAPNEVLSSWDSAIAYLHLAHGNPRKEVFRVLFLNRRNQLIADKVLGEGTIDHCPAYPREIIREALLCDASALILCHNHPSGDPTPSQGDIAMTKQIEQGAGFMGITVHDHIIIGNGRDCSMRSKGLMS
jgi:DNA repair protein RadC